MKKMLITGASGLLGQFLCNYFSKTFKVTGLYHSHAYFSPNLLTKNLDLTKAEETKSYLEQYCPDFVIHTAGMTIVDECEKNPDLAFLNNVVMTKNICNSINDSCKLIYISSDHLVTGEKSYNSEKDELNPLNVYGKTKAEAERLVQELKNSLIIRTNFYGGKTSKKLSFSNWIVNELKIHESPIRMVSDVYFSPISTPCLAYNLNEMIKANLKGIYNVAGSERLNKFEFAIEVAKIFNLSSELIESINLKDLNLIAKRPKDMSLDISKIIRELPTFQKETVPMGLRRLRESNLI